MKTFFKLFIVVTFSIISLNSYSQGNSDNKKEHEYGIGTVKIIDNNHILIESIYDPRQVYISDKPNGADIQFDDGDLVSYKIIILPNDRIIFKEIKKIEE